jgi:hypothetical protein
VNEATRDVRYEVEICTSLDVSPVWRSVNLGRMTEQQARAKLADYHIGRVYARLVMVTTFREVIRDAKKVPA